MACEEPFPVVLVSIENAVFPFCFSECRLARGSWGGFAFKGSLKYGAVYKLLASY